MSAEFRTAEQTLNKIIGQDFKKLFGENDTEWILKAMIEYGRQCAERMREECAENAEIIQCDTEYNSRTGDRDPVYCVDRQSILNTPIDFIK